MRRASGVHGSPEVGMSVFRDPNKGACPLLRAAPEGSDVLAKPLKIQQKGLDKMKLTPIIRQTDRQTDRQTG